MANSGKEDHLFDLAMEIELNENYEDNYKFRIVERREKEQREREQFYRRQFKSARKGRSYASFLGSADAKSKTPGREGVTRNRAGMLDRKSSFTSETSYRTQSVAQSRDFV